MSEHCFASVYFSHRVDYKNFNIITYLRAIVPNSAVAIVTLEEIPNN